MSVECKGSAGVDALAQSPLRIERFRGAARGSTQTHAHGHAQTGRHAYARRVGRSERTDGHVSRLAASRRELEVRAA